MKSLGEIASPFTFKDAGQGLFPACSGRQAGVPLVLSATAGLWTTLGCMWLWDLDQTSTLQVSSHMALPEASPTQQTDGCGHIYVKRTTI